VSNEEDKGNGACDCSLSWPKLTYFSATESHHVNGVKMMDWCVLLEVGKRPSSNSYQEGKSTKIGHQPPKPSIGPNIVQTDMRKC
jgi:hypothetical protein